MLLKKLSSFLIISILVVSCTSFQDNRNRKIEEFQSEMIRLNDSSTFYFNMGISLLENGKSSSEVSTLIKPELMKFQTKLNTKANGFQKIAIDLNLSEEENKAVFDSLNKIFKDNLEKYQFLKKNGVIIK